MYYLGFGKSPGLEVPLRCLVLSQVARAAQQPQFDEEISFKLHSEQQLQLWWYGKKSMLGKVCCSGTVQWDQQIMPDISDPQGGCLKPRNQCGPVQIRPLASTVRGGINNGEAKNSV